MHLAPEQLIDLAEGTAPEDSAPHLRECTRCRQQLTDLRATLASARDVEVPEPSPLFWDHLSARITEAVAAEPVRAGWNWWLRAALPLGLGAAAALAIAFAITTRVVPRSDSDPVSVMAQGAAAAGETLSPDVSDPSLELVADLTQDIGWEDAREAGLASRGSAEHAVTHLSESELRQLHDLLQEAMANPSD